MARYVIDAPTLVHVVSQSAAVHADHQLVAPNSIRSRALTLLLGAVGRSEISEQSALDQHERLTAIKLRLLGDRVSRRAAWQIAREQGWETIEEAEHIALARLQADALVTLDSAMASRCRGLVPLAPVGALFTASGA